MMSTWHVRLYVTITGLLLLVAGGYLRSQFRCYELEPDADANYNEQSTAPVRRSDLGR